MSYLPRVSYEETLAYLLSLVGQRVFVNVTSGGVHGVASLSGTLERASHSDWETFPVPVEDVPLEQEAMAFRLAEDGLAGFVVHRAHFERASIDGPALWIDQLGLSLGIVRRP